MALQKIIFDVSTGETTTQEFNADDLAQLELNKTQAKLDAAAIAAKQAARQAVLDKLGLTADEANALLG
jgi:hypothetical protein